MASPNGPRLARISTLPTCTFLVSSRAHRDPPRIRVLLHALNAVMAFVTYILLAALYSGLNSRFHPEILGVTASKALAVVLLDFFFVKSGCYFLNIPVSACVYV